jgi:branched-chain amino acid transport system substrate-binding protein
MRVGTVRQSALLALALVAAGVVAAVGTAGSNAGTIKIGAIDSQTGLVADAGQSDICGFKIASNAINDRGGANGAKLQITVADDQGNPSVAAQQAQQLTSQGIKLFVGGATSGVVLAELPILNDAGALHTGGTTQSAQVLTSGKYVVRINASSDSVGPVIARYIGGILNAKSVVFVATQGAFGQGSVAAVQKALNPKVNVAATYFVAADTTDFASVITQISSKNPDGIVLALAGSAQPVGFIQQARQASLRGEIIYPGGPSYSNAHAAGAAANGVVGADVWASYLKNAANVLLKADWKKYRGRFSECKGKFLDKQVVISYSQVLLLAQAITATKSTDPAKLRAAIVARQWRLPQGKIGFRADGQAQVAYYMVKIKNGNVVKWTRG